MKDNSAPEMRSALYLELQKNGRYDVVQSHAAIGFLRGLEGLASGIDDIPTSIRKILDKKRSRESDIGKESEHVLTLFYTESHEKHKTDPFTLLMTKVEAGDADAADTLVAFAVKRLRDSSLKASDFDVVIYVPGSNPETPKNRAYYLAKALSKAMGIPFIDDNIFEFGPNWKGTPQKFTDGINGRIVNAGNKFAGVRNDKLQNKRVLVVEDVNTSGVTLARVRNVLYMTRAENGGHAKKVVILSFAQSVSGDFVPLGTLRSFEPATFAP